MHSFGNLVLHVIDPVDLAVSKVARFSERDRDDIRELAGRGLIDPDRFAARAEEALAEGEARACPKAPFFGPRAPADALQRQDLPTAAALRQAKAGIAVLRRPRTSAASLKPPEIRLAAPFANGYEKLALCFPSGGIMNTKHTKLEAIVTDWINFSDNFSQYNRSGVYVFYAVKGDDKRPFYAGQSRPSQHGRENPARDFDSRPYVTTRWDARLRS